MAKGKKSKFKSGLALDVEQGILGMSPTDLAIDVTFERNAIEALNKHAREDDKIGELKEKLKAFEEELKGQPDVLKAKQKYDEARDENTSAEHLEAKADLSALKKGYADDIKDRKKKLKYMEKTLQRHIESGALKRKK